MLTVTRYPDAAAFLAAVGPGLETAEALNSVMLGGLHAMRRQTLPRRRGTALFAAILENGRPVVAAVQTRPGKLLLAGDAEAADGALAALAADLALTHPSLPSVFGPAALSGRFAEAWAAAVGVSAQRSLEQRLFELREVRYPADLPAGAVRVASFGERALLAEWLWAFQMEALPEEASDHEASRFIIDRLLANDDLFVWRVEADGQERSVSMAARARPTERGVAVNLVYTPPDLRRRGYATACVAHLSQRLLDTGWQFCTLFTDRGNPTANHIYETIGYVPLADFDEYRFAGVPAAGDAGHGRPEGS